MNNSLYTKRQHTADGRNEQRVHYVRVAAQARGYRYGVRINRAIRALWGKRRAQTLTNMRASIARLILNSTRRRTAKRRTR